MKALFCLLALALFCGCAASRQQGMASDIDTTAKGGVTVVASQCVVIVRPTMLRETGLLADATNTAPVAVMPGASSSGEGGDVLTNPEPEPDGEEEPAAAAEADIPPENPEPGE